jgi:hypothetical protein
VNLMAQPLSKQRLNGATGTGPVCSKR